MKPVSRRDFIKGAAGAIGLAAAASPAMGSLLAAVCGPATLPQPEGPFYPVEDGLDEDTDLTRVKGHAGLAQGEIIYLTGTVQDQDCRPVPGALVEIWQANKHGRYNHPGDAQNPAPLDPDFQYWGQTASGLDGGYLFKTIIPGHYPAGDGWMRPPHIHFKVSAKGFHEIITQMYFAGNQYNADDRILQSLPPDEQSRVVCSPTDAPVGLDPTIKAYRFEVFLKKVR